MNRTPEADLREVIGRHGERVTLADALKNPERFHVDTAAGQIWDRDYWNQIHSALGEGN